MARVTLSLVIFASRAFSSESRRRGLPSGSPPPAFAATVISLIRRVKTLPFLESAAALRCLIFAHLLWPDMEQFYASGQRVMSNSGATGMWAKPRVPSSVRVMWPSPVVSSTKSSAPGAKRWRLPSSSSISPTPETTTMNWRCGARCLSCTCEGGLSRKNRRSAGKSAEVARPLRSGCIGTSRRSMRALPSLSAKIRVTIMIAAVGILRAEFYLSAASYHRWGIAFGLFGVLAFSLRPILIKLSYAAYPVSPTTLLFLRMLLSLPFFAAAAFFLRRKEPRLTLRDWLAIVGLRLVGYYAASFLDFLGLQYIGAGVGRLILFLYPTLVLLLSFLFLHKRPGGRELAALLLSYAGIALVVSNQVGAGREGRLFLLGVLLVFASALCYAVYLVAGSQMVRRVGSMRFTAYTMVVATVPAVLQFFLFEPVTGLRLPPPVWSYSILLV